MKRFLTLGLLAALLVSTGCRSKASKLRVHQKRIDQIITKCDKYMTDKKPAYAIRYYRKYIKYYSRYRGLEASVAKMYAKRAEAYSALGNMRLANTDVAAARKLDAQVVVPQAPPPAVQPTATENPGTSPPSVQPGPVLGPDGIPAHQGDPIPIAVLNFEGAEDGQKYAKTFGPLLADDLFNRGRFDVIERDELDKLVGELKLTHTDLVSKAGSAESSKLLSVKFLVLGTITVEGNGVVVNARLVDWSTGQRVVTQTVKKMCQTANISFYLDEIAHDLGVALEKAFVKKFPPEDTGDEEDLGWRKA
jgi:TolB-like protein